MTADRGIFLNKGLNNGHKAFCLKGVIILRGVSGAEISCLPLWFSILSREEGISQLTGHLMLHRGCYPALLPCLTLTQLSMDEILNAY